VIPENKLLEIRDKIVRMRKITDELLARGVKVSRGEAYIAVLESEKLKESLKLKYL